MFIHFKILVKKTDMSKTNCGRLLSPFLSILLFASVTVAQSNITLSGRVLDKSTNEPLAGATVHIKGTTHEVTTDERGHFNFLTGQKLPVTYIITFVGYQTFEITQTKDALLSVLLQRESSQLNEVVVTGYSTQSKKNIHRCSFAGEGSSA